MIKKRVLVGGDSDLIAMATDFFSNKGKFNISITHDGEETIRGIMATAPHLAILDVDLPKKRGDECCKTVKQAGISPSSLIVLLVCPENRRDIGRCLDAGCDALLLKPLKYERLSGVVSRLLYTEKHIPTRFPVRLPVHHGIQPDNLTDNYSVNLTTKGIFLEAREVMPVGTPLQVVFTLPYEGTTIECTARVTWLNNDQRLPRESQLPRGMGLEFVDIKASHVEAIRRFLYSDRRGLQHSF